MAMSGQEIYDNFANGPGTGGLESSRDQLARVMAGYQQLSMEVTEAADAFEQGWTGDAAGAAQRGLGPWAVEHARASEEMTTGLSLLYSQISGLHRAKAHVVSVPLRPPVPLAFDEIIIFL